MNNGESIPGAAPTDVAVATPRFTKKLEPNFAKVSPAFAFSFDGQVGRLRADLALQQAMYLFK